MSWEQPSAMAATPADAPPFGDPASAGRDDAQGEPSPEVDASPSRDLGPRARRRRERAGMRSVGPVREQAQKGPRRQQVRARKVPRIVRRVDAWSILKFSLLFYFCTFLILMVAGVLLWSAAQSAGTIEGFEGFIEDIGGYDFFRFEGDQIFRAALLGGLILVVAGSAGTVLLAALFNLISDLTGGIRLTVVEEEKSVPVRPSGESKAEGSESPQRPARPPAVSEL